jgi:hypothetical protein
MVLAGRLRLAEMNTHSLDKFEQPLIFVPRPIALAPLSTAHLSFAFAATTAQPLSIAILKTDFRPGSFNTSSAALNESIF